MDCEVLSVAGVEVWEVAAADELPPFFMPDMAPARRELCACAMVPIAASNMPARNLPRVGDNAKKEGHEPRAGRRCIETQL